MINIENHEDISNQLLGFVKNHKVPNVLLYGPSKAGKKKILKKLLYEIYSSHLDKMSTYVKIVNCAHTNGIQFVRDDLKLFSKMNLHHNGDLFKSVVLLNADKLTLDSQSAIRRLIEVSNHSTRFFIVVEDKNKMLKPILSRFCEFYISPNKDNLFSYLFCESSSIIEEKNSNEIMEINTKEEEKEKKTNCQENEICWLCERILEMIDRENKRIKEKENINIDFLSITSQEMVELFDLSIELYEASYSGLDLLTLIENTKEKKKHIFHQLSNAVNYSYLCLVLQRLRREIRHEPQFIFTILYFLTYFFKMKDDRSFQTYCQSILQSLLI